MSSKQHWENIYTTTLPNEVSWTETEPKTSLHLIAKFNLPKDAKIIDIGGGDSHLVDFLDKAALSEGKKISLKFTASNLCKFNDL